MKCADMIDIMKFHHQYVSVVEYEERTRCDEIGDVIVKDAVMYPFLFGGDQLSVARQRTALKVMSNAAVHFLGMASFDDLSTSSVLPADVWLMDRSKENVYLNLLLLQLFQTWLTSTMEAVVFQHLVITMMITYTSTHNT